jgi:hypothetical protein
LAHCKKKRKEKELGRHLMEQIGDMNRRHEMAKK